MRIFNALLILLLTTGLAFAQILKIDDATTAEGVDGTENIPISKLPAGGNKRVPRKMTPQQILDAGLDATFGDLDLQDLTVAGLPYNATYFTELINGSTTTLHAHDFSSQVDDNVTSYVDSLNLSALYVQRWLILPGVSTFTGVLNDDTQRIKYAWLSIYGREFDYDDLSKPRASNDSVFQALGPGNGTHFGVQVSMDYPWLSTDASTRQALGQPETILATLIYALQDASEPDYGTVFWLSSLSTITVSGSTIEVDNMQPFTFWSQETMRLY